MTVTIVFAENRYTVTRFRYYYYYYFILKTSGMREYAYITAVYKIVINSLRCTMITTANHRMDRSFISSLALHQKLFYIYIYRGGFKRPDP